MQVLPFCASVSLFAACKWYFWDYDIGAGNPHSHHICEVRDERWAASNLNSQKQKMPKMRGSMKPRAALTNIYVEVQLTAKPSFMLFPCKETRCCLSSEPICCWSALGSLHCFCFNFWFVERWLLQGHTLLCAFVCMNAVHSLFGLCEHHLALPLSVINTIILIYKAPFMRVRGNPWIMEYRLS